MDRNRLLAEHSKVIDIICEMMNQGLTANQRAALTPLMNEIREFYEDMPEDDDDLEDKDILRSGRLQKQMISILING